MLKKPATSGKKFATLSDYIQSRVDAAGNFSSTKVWIKAHEIAEAAEILNSAGFKSKELQRDDKGSVQLEVSW